MPRQLRQAGARDALDGKGEGCVLDRALMPDLGEHPDKALGFVGGLIRVNGEVIAYTMGEPQMSGRCFVSHFEKAPNEIQGAYAIINQEFTKNCLMQFEYVNREEDLGIEGLRKAKQSYHPEIILDKCVAVYND